MSHIPIVDLVKLVDDGENAREDPDWISVASKVREGLGSVGFLYIVNHGIPDETIASVFAESKNFFALDAKVKMKYKKDTSLGSNAKFEMDKYFGYTPPGGESLHPDGKVELKEIYDWLDGRGVYPDTELPKFEPSIAKLDLECKKFLKKFLRLLAISLKMDDIDFFVKCCGYLEDSKNYKGLYNIRLLHYPPLENNDEQTNGDNSVRLGAHTDYGFITLLFQDDAGGLEVQTVDGNWVEAKPVQGSILINTGDLIEFWTCGIFPATPHRVIIPDANDEKRSKARYSVVFFNGPEADVIVTPMEFEKTEMEERRLVKTGRTYSKDSIKAWDHMMGRIANQYK